MTAVPPGKYTEAKKRAEELAHQNRELVAKIHTLEETLRQKDKQLQETAAEMYRFMSLYADAMRQLNLHAAKAAAVQNPKPEKEETNGSES